ncbi:hypothetical protein INP83_07030 [Mucilaginibacter sp. 21P]|uniref:hypothetical protein n=1 Tax=Mucilaginibacter sp. 21P TaxID=2778902 RepID=UPI001C567A82|nr:hypothetical protein [Mucilaginibacter sp. 21P]QXV66830.1 hypothetical protein INP83_07030 [Mucilaginibacter sp. 21P]
MSHINLRKRFGSVELIELAADKHFTIIRVHRTGKCCRANRDDQFGCVIREREATPCISPQSLKSFMQVPLDPANTNIDLQRVTPVSW